MTDLVQPNPNNHKYQFETHPNNYEVSFQLLQTLAKLIGYDELTEQFDFVRIDSSGRLAVNTGALAKKTGNSSAVPVDTTVDVIVSENEDRNQLDIYNNGGNTVFIGFSNTVTPAIGFPIPPGFSFSFTSYNGPIWGVTSVGATDIRVLEVA